MANAYTPEEIIELKAREADEIKRLGQATVETRMALIDMAAGTKGLTASLTKGFGSLGTSAMDLSKQLYNGNTGLSVFNNSIDTVGDALGDLAGKIPYVGRLFKSLIKGGGEYTKAVNLHADQLYKSYQEMSQIGATTAGGVSDLYDNLKRMNYNSTTEMGVFTSLVRENSLTLSNFGKTVGSGLTEIAKVSEAIQDGAVGRQFLLMGMSIDDINRGIIGFTKMQMLTGGRQKMTTDELISASENYIKEIDLLAKITGKDRASQEKSRESAMTEERYAGLTYELQQRANMNDEAAKAQLTTNDRIQQQMEKDAPGLRKGFLNILSGTINTPEAKQFALAMPRAAAVAQKKLFTQAEYEEAVREDLTRNLKGTGDQIVGAGTKLAQIGAYGATFGSLGEQIKYLGTLEQGTFEQRKAQADKEKIVTDQATQSIVDTNIQNRKTRDTLQDLIHYGIVPVTGAMKTAAGATNSLTEAFESAAKKLGVVIKKREEPGAAEQAPVRPAAPRPVAEGVRVSGSAEAKTSAEKYYGRPISDAEFSALIKATHAEAAGGKQASQQEQAMIMASVLNRARDDKGGIMAALTAKNQFQSVTGTAKAPGPSEHYLKGPEAERLKSIEGATKLLENISLQQKNFASADPRAYGPGTNIGYMHDLEKRGGAVVGGSIFNTAPPPVPDNQKPKPVLAPAEPKTERAPIPLKNTAPTVDIDPKALLPRAKEQPAIIRHPLNATQQEAARENLRNRGNTPPAAEPVAPTPQANGGVIPAVKGGVNVLAAEAGKNEAFVPLPDGKTIPVTIANNVEQMGMMVAQIDRLDNMIQLMKNQLGVSEKILKYAQ